MNRIEIINADITQLDVGAIVTPASHDLMGGGWLDRAIHHAAGLGLLAECCTLKGCEPGGAKISRGYDLPAQHVIHTVCPVWDDGEGDEPLLLASCYRASLQLAEQHGLTTIAFPLLSAGVDQVPLDIASEIALEVVAAYLRHSQSIRQVLFVCPQPAVERSMVQSLERLDMPLPIAV